VSEYIHIVCLDVPSPPDYGGAIDMYHKIVALRSIGKKIILHYFNYKNNRDAEDLKKYCEEINVYNRSSFLKSLFTLKPYIVSSRTAPELINRLKLDDYPVIIEGIHCTGIIPHLNAKKKIVVRVHNNEAKYYKSLAISETNLFKKFYFFYESVLLNKYQKKLSSKFVYACISVIDEVFFRDNYHLWNTHFIPSFIPWQKILSKNGKGNYCLYHGNLSISENKKAALWLIKNILPKVDLPLIVAGKSAADVENILLDKKQVQFINDPSDAQLTELIQNAHINLVPSFNSTGVKLKLLHALIEGRFCISNNKGAAGSGIEDYVMQAESIDDWINAIRQKQSMDFSDEMIEERKKVLSLYNNSLNAEKLMALL
jgi:hypothetical protein